MPTTVGDTFYLSDGTNYREFEVISSNTAEPTGLTVTACSAPTDTPTPTPTNTPTPTPTNTPTLYDFTGTTSTTSATDACSSLSKTLKSTTNDGFGNGTLVDGTSVVYNSFGNIITNTYVSDTATVGSTNVNGVWSSSGICGTP